MMNKMRKMNNKKGFTLMEMLIVVAIIAILIAIAIPTFANSLNKARVATDEANIRSGYAAVMTEILTDEAHNVEGSTTGTTPATFTLKKDGTVSTTAGDDAYTTQGKPSDNVEIAGKSVNKWEKGQKVTYTYHYDTNTIDIAVGAASSTPDVSTGK